MQIRSHATHRIYTSFKLFQRTESLLDASFLILFGNPDSKMNQGNRPKYEYYVRCTKYSTRWAKTIRRSVTTFCKLHKFQGICIWILPLKLRQLAYASLGRKNIFMLKLVIGSNCWIGPMASFENFNETRDQIVPVQPIGCRSRFRSDSVGRSVGRLNGRS